jgi:signal transduction histidine kinase
MTAKSVSEPVQGKDSGRSLIVGFILVLTLMAVISLTGLLYLHRHNQGMEHIVTVHNEKTRLLQLMKDAMRERQISMRDMLLQTDDFERDEAWQLHNQAASRFLSAREAFSKLQITPAEEAAYTQFGESVTIGGFAQQALVEGSLADQKNDALRPVLEKALEAQQAAFVQLQRLQGIQLDAAHQALENARRNYRFITLLTLTIGSVCLIVGAMIAISVVRQFRRNMQQINSQKVHLEDTVERRTADLRAAVHELEALSYSLAHDLRTPLRAVTGFRQILLHEGHDRFNDDDRRQLQRIASAGSHMAQLIDDIRTLGKLSRAALDLQNTDLSALADDTLYELRMTSTSGEFESSVEEGLLAYADPALIRLVFRNLFENSLKFASSERPLQLRFGRSEQARDVYCVSDNGCGFDMLYAEKIFKPFERLHKAEDYSGTGIGLAIVERVIRRHGGRIWAESKLNDGARVYFTLGKPPNSRL